jgi:hypothetical protein
VIAEDCRFAENLEEGNLDWGIQKMKILKTYLVVKH